MERCPPLTYPANGIDVDYWDALGTYNNMYGFIGDTSMSADISANKSNAGDNGVGGKVRAHPAENPCAQPEIRRL